MSFSPTRKLTTWIALLTLISSTLSFSAYAGRGTTLSSLSRFTPRQIKLLGGAAIALSPVAGLTSFVSIFGNFFGGNPNFGKAMIAAGTSVALGVGGGYLLEDETDEGINFPALNSETLATLEGLKLGLSSEEQNIYREKMSDFLGMIDGIAGELANHEEASFQNSVDTWKQAIQLYSDSKLLKDTEAAVFQKVILGSLILSNEEFKKWWHENQKEISENTVPAEK